MDEDKEIYGTVTIGDIPVELEHIEDLKQVPSSLKHQLRLTISVKSWVLQRHGSEA